MPSPTITDEMFAAYERLGDVGSSPAQAFDIGWREGVTAERLEIESRFWSIVDGDGLSGLPSDMWAALDSLVNKASLARRYQSALRQIAGYEPRETPVLGLQIAREVLGKCPQ